MNDLKSRYIQVVIDNNTYIVPVESSVYNNEEEIEVIFTFNREAVPAFDVSYVTAVRREEQVVMTTERGTAFTKGPLYNQLIEWYNVLFPSR